MTSPSERGGGPQHVYGDVISVRELAEQMDHEYPPERIRGNGPPGDDREKIETQHKVTYRLPACHDDSSYVDRTYVKSDPNRAERLAYDLGMINRIEVRKGGSEADDDEYLEAVRNGSLAEKGLIETHRWRQDEINQGDHRSLRSVASRHREGSVHKCVWLNTKLLSLLTYEWGGADHRAPRARAIGAALGQGDYDLVALCEVDNIANAVRIGGQFGSHTSSGPVVDYFGPDSTAPAEPVGTSGLFSMVATGGPRSVSESSIYAKIYHRTGPDAITKGYQHVPVSTPEGGFDLFLTHLRPGNKSKQNRTRKNQLAELAAWVWHRQKTKSEWPKVVVGDMNLHAKNPTQYRLLDKFLYQGNFQDLPSDLCAEIKLTTGMDVCGKQADLRLQDCWLTRGGPARNTLSKQDWTLKGPTPGDHGGRPGEWGTCYADDFCDTGKDGQRIDHVFVSEPRSAHETRVDIGRMWRVPMHPGCDATTGDQSISVKERDRLTDHAGWGFEIVTSSYD